MFPPLPKKKYDIIYADPCWDYKGQSQTGKKSKVTGKNVLTGGALSHYGTVVTPDLKTLDVKSIAKKDCLLFMWTSSPHLDQAIELLKSWGFKYVTIGFVWYKERTNPGYYTMSQCEICIIGRRGRIPKPRGTRNERQFLSELRGEHSAKPDEIANRIHRMFPTLDKIELFARTARDNFDCWGDEAPETMWCDDCGSEMRMTHDHDAMWPISGGKTVPITVALPKCTVCGFITTRKTDRDAIAALNKLYDLAGDPPCSVLAMATTSTSIDT